MSTFKVGDRVRLKSFEGSDDVHGFVIGNEYTVHKVTETYVTLSGYGIEKIDADGRPIYISQIELVESKTEAQKDWFKIGDIVEVAKHCDHNENAGIKMNTAYVIHKIPNTYGDADENGGQYILKNLSTSEVCERTMYGNELKIVHNKPIPNNKTVSLPYTPSTDENPCESNIGRRVIIGGESLGYDVPVNGDIYTIIGCDTCHYLIDFHKGVNGTGWYKHPSNLTFHEGYSNIKDGIVSNPDTTVQDILGPTIGKIVENNQQLTKYTGSHPLSGMEHGDDGQVMFSGQHPCGPFSFTNMIGRKIGYGTIAGEETIGESIIRREKSLINQFKPKIMNLTKSFKNLFVSEPQKTFQKVGIPFEDGSFTREGQNIFLSYLLNKYGEDFKKEVVDQIVKEDKKDSK